MMAAQEGDEIIVDILVACVSCEGRKKEGWRREGWRGKEGGGRRGVRVSIVILFLMTARLLSS